MITKPFSRLMASIPRMPSVPDPDRIMPGPIALLPGQGFKENIYGGVGQAVFDLFVELQPPLPDRHNFFTGQHIYAIRANRHGVLGFEHLHQSMPG